VKSDVEDGLIAWPKYGAARRAENRAAPTCSWACVGSQAAIVRASRRPGASAVGCSRSATCRQQSPDKSNEPIRGGRGSTEPPQTTAMMAMGRCVALRGEDLKHA
jgi:hypothetical protein